MRIWLRGILSALLCRSHPVSKAKRVAVELHVTMDDADYIINTSGILKEGNVKAIVTLRSILYELGRRGVDGNDR